MSRSSLSLPPSRFLMYKKLQSHHFPVHLQSLLLSLSAHLSHPWISGYSMKTSHLFLSSSIVRTSGSKSRAPTAAAAMAAPGVAADVWVTYSFLICFSILPTNYQSAPCTDPSLLEIPSAFYFPD